MMMLRKRTSSERVTRARIMLLRKQPFFGTLAMQLPLIEDETIPTLMTDFTSIFYNPKYVETLSDEVLQAAIAHEIMHNVLLHGTRRGDRDKGRWNRAGDYCENAILREAGFTLGEGWLYNNKYDGKTTDEIYNLLKSDEDDSGGGGKQHGKEGCGWYKECDHSTDTKEVEDRVRQMVASAAAAMTGVGTMPGSIQALIKSLLHKPADWRQLMRLFVEEVARNDFSWATPNRRHIGRGIALPVLRNKQIKPFVVAFDISGSVDDKLVGQFVSAVSDLLMEIKPESSQIVQCDTKIQKVETYLPEDMPLKTFAIAGRGGTDFKPVFKWIEDEDVEPSGLIYFTDLAVGSSEFPKYEPDYPVLWVVPANADAKRAPFGTTVKMF